MGLSSGRIFHLISLFWGINSGWGFFSGLLQSKGQVDKNQLLLQCYTVKVPVPVEINSSQAQSSGILCHRDIYEVGKWPVNNSCCFFCPQSSPHISQISFLFTNRAATLLFCNPSDELWMLPGLIFIKSVIKKNHIFPLHPYFTVLQQQKHDLYIPKFSCHLKTNSLPLCPCYFPQPWGSTGIAFLGSWDVESSSLVPKRGSEESIYRATACLGVKTEGEDAHPGML